EIFHRFGGTRDQGLDRAIGAVAHPAIQLIDLGRHHQEIAKADALDKTFDPDQQGSIIVIAHVNSMMMSSRAMLSPILAFSFEIVASRSAIRTFSIFIASTTASTSPILTAWPSWTGSATSSPGMGQINMREVSGDGLLGINAAN